MRGGGPRCERLRPSMCEAAAWVASSRLRHVCQSGDMLTSSPKLLKIILCLAPTAGPDLEKVKPWHRLSAAHRSFAASSLRMPSSSVRSFPAGRKPALCWKTESPCESSVGVPPQGSVGRCSQTNERTGCDPPSSMSQVALRSRFFSRSCCT